jgi:hypothetical protein
MFPPGGTSRATVNAVLPAERQRNTQPQPRTDDAQRPGGAGTARGSGRASLIADAFTPGRRRTRR